MKTNKTKIVKQYGIEETWFLARLIRKGQERPHVPVLRKTRQKWRNKRAGVHVQSYIYQEKKQQTTNLARIWHCYLCPSPRPPSTLRSPTFRPFIGYREGLGRGGWLVYTAYDITFKIRTRTHWRRLVFSAAPFLSPPNKELFFFFSHVYIYFYNRLITSFPSKWNCLVIN